MDEYIGERKLRENEKWINIFIIYSLVNIARNIINLLVVEFLLKLWI